MRIRGTVKHGQCRSHQEPIGFGLKSIKFIAVVNDAGGETDMLEKTIGAIPGVERAEILEVTLT
jgi:elongation factor 1-beta